MRELLGLINLPSSHRGPRMMWRRDVLRLSAQQSYQAKPRLGLCSIGENEAITRHLQRAPCSSRDNAIESVNIEVLRRRPTSHAVSTYWALQRAFAGRQTPKRTDPQCFESTELLAEKLPIKQV